MKRKKKFNMIYVYIGIVIVLFGSIFIINNSGKDNVLYGMPVSELNPATRALLDDPNYQNIILPADLDKKIADKDDFFLYVFSSTCPYCLNTTPHLKPLADELSIDLPMFNLLEFQSYKNKLNIEYTPTLVYFKDGVEVGRMESGLREEGAASGHTLDDFKAFFLQHSGAASE